MMQVADRTIFSVTEVNDLAKQLLEQVSVWVEGEIYDYRDDKGRYYYIYFQLKDAAGQTILPCVILPQAYAGLNFDFTNGQKILAHGKLTLFTKSGKFQFQVDTAELAGEGQLARQLEALKRKLQSEGLFAQEKKRPLPAFPHRVGVVTSEASDAWADFRKHSATKFPLIELILADVFVQGPRAVSSIVTALQRLQQQQLDVIVLTRGGGSLEDLSAFNDERVARAIADSSIPTLVAVGHEKDLSIADLVADVRASTPTNAGQILTASYEEALAKLTYDSGRLDSLADVMLSSVAQRLDSSLSQLQRSRRLYQLLPVRLQIIGSALGHHFSQLTTAQSSRLNMAELALNDRSTAWLSRKLLHLEMLNRQLQSVSPLSVLARGYSLVEHNGQIVFSSSQLKQGDTIQVRLHDGRIEGSVTSIEGE